MEWLEVFFVSYYFTALMYYVNHNQDLFRHDYGLWTLVAAPAVSGGIALLGLQPYKLHTADAGVAEPATSAVRQPGRKRHWNRPWVFLSLLVLAFILWLGVGFACFPAGSGHPPGCHLPTGHWASLPHGTGEV